MVTYTTTYNFAKPTVGDDEDVWGGYLNGNFDTLESLLKGTTALTSISVTGSLSDGTTSRTVADIVGLTSSQFLRSDVDDTATGAITIATTGGGALTLKDTNGAGTSAATWIDFDDSGGTRVGYVGMGSSSTGNNFLYAVAGSPVLASANASAPQYYNGSGYTTIWHAGNDGSGSGLDADTVDGIQASSFLRSDANDSTTGVITSTAGSTTRGVIETDDTNQWWIKLSSYDVGVYWNTTNNNINIRNGYGLLQYNDNTVWHAGNDGSGSGLDADLLDGQQGSYYLNTSTTFGGDVSGTYDAIVVANDSHTHTFDNLTAKEAGTGDYATTGDLQSGKGSGGVALTINDGGGNANVTFNHKSRVPEQNGQSARIEVNTDNTTSGNAHMYFELGGATSGVTSNLPVIFELGEDDVIARKPLEVVGDITVSGTVDGVDIAGSIDQAVLTTSSPTFGGMTLNGTLTLGSNVINDVEDIYLRDRIYHDGDTDTYMQFHGANLWRVVTGGSEQIEVGGGYLLMNDNKTFRMGTGSDFRQYFDGTNMIFRNYNHAAGDIYIQGEDTSGVNHTMASFISSNAAPYVNLYYDGSIVFNTVSGGVNVNGNINAVDNIYLASTIYHEGDTDTYIDFDVDGVNIRTGGTDRIIVNSTGVRLGDSGNGYFQPVSGNYGSVQIDGGAHGGYEGYSIGGRATFMHDNGVYTGLYNDVDDQWILLNYRNNYTALYYAGSSKLQTTSTGVSINGNLYTYGSNAEDYDALSGTSVTCNVDNAGAFSLTMTGNTTFTFSGADSNWSMGFILQLTGNGGTVTWPTSVDWAGGTAPDAPAAGETDIYVFWTRDGGTTWYGVQSIDAAA